MGSRSAAPTIAALILVSLILLSTCLPPAGAQPAPFDPLTLDVPGWLGPGGAIVRAAPPAGPVDFAASTPAAPGAPLAFSFVAPITFAPKGFAIALHLTTAKPFVTQNSDKQSLRLALVVDGKPADNATQMISFSAAVATPGGAEDIAATLVSPGLVIAKGANVTLLVTALAPVLPDGALSVALGPSRADFPGARVPSLADLEIQDAPLQQFLLSNGSFTTTERNAAVYVVHVKHDGVDIESKRDPTLTVSKIFVVLRGEEPATDAVSHQDPDRARRIAAAHVFMADGQLVRVHPGVGVVVALDWNGRNLTVPLACAQNCPAAGFHQALSFAALVSPTGDSAGSSTLIPPPRDTTGIPTSQDAPPEKHLLAMPWLALVGLSLAIAAARRR